MKISKTSIKKTRKEARISMKLSEILKDWPENRDCACGLVYCECTHYVWNDALTSCDREIDKEALAKEIFKRDKKVLTWDEAPTLHEEYFKEAEWFISTMPTWLKKAK